MSFNPPGPVSTSVFIVIIVTVVLSFLAGAYFAHRRLGLPALKPTLWAAAGVLTWIGVTSFMVANGIVAAKPMPRLPLFFLVLNLVAFLTAFSPFGNRLAHGLPLAALVGFQAFRLPLELVLHSWAEQGSIPVTMTWTGRNFDIVSGLIAVLLAPLAAKSRLAAWVANAVGFALLLNVMRVAMMSSPLPFAWNVEPPLQVAFHLPYALIAPVCVAGALLGHLVLTRALLRKLA